MSPDDMRHGFVGALHGGFDFATNQIAQLAPFVAPLVRMNGMIQKID